MKTTTTTTTTTVVKKRSMAQEIWRNFKKNKGAVIGLIVLSIILLTAATVDFWLDEELVIGQNLSQRLQKPSAQHLFGTDDKGRDLFWRIVYGSRYSIAIGFVAVIVSCVVGIPLGAIAGYYGGKIENLIMRCCDIFAAIPGILMATIVVAVLGNDMINLMIAIGISSVPSFARTTRAAVLTVRNEEYVEAARALGKSETYIIFRHVLPNCLSPIIVQVTLRVASAIIAASSLSFLGLGIAPPHPEWGSLLQAGRDYIRGYSYLTVFPGLAIMVTVIAFNMVGDGLRDSLDPKLKH